MYKNHSIYKRLIFLVLMVVLSCANIGFSSFQYIADNDSANITDDFAQETSNGKTLSLIPMAINGLAYEYTYLNPTTGQVTDSKQTLSVNNESSYSTFKTAIQANTDDANFLNQFLNLDSTDATLTNPNPDDVIIPAGTYSAISKTDNKTFIIEVITELKFSSFFFFAPINSYSGTVSIYLQESFIEYVALENFTTIDINFTNEITTSQAANIVLQELAKCDPEITYSVLGFYNSFNNGELGNKYTNNIFTDTTTIYLALYKPIYEQIGKYSVTETINNIQSGTYDFYVNNPAGGGQNIWNDYSYDQTTSSFNLGFSNLATTVSQSSIINFALNDGFKLDLNKSEYQPPSAPSYANPDTQQNSKQYTIKLINDLYINGTLNLHSKVGNNTSSSMQSSINGGYVNLDLNGHNIYISSTGTLNSYGIIEDSVGNGTINVSAGGTLASYVTIEDYKSGSSTAELVNQKVFPFTNYFFPYLRCNVFIECTKNIQNIISTGTFNGIVSLKLINNIKELGPLGVVPIANMTLNFIGTGDNTFFKINDILSNNTDITSGVYLNFHFNENANFDDFSTDSNEYRYLTTIRNKRNFVNLDISLSKLTMDVAGALGGFFETALGWTDELPSIINTDEYFFPLPSYFDLNFVNSIFRFSQPVQILPGASLYFDENCFVYLEYNTSRSAGLYSSGDAVNVFKNGTFINNRRSSTSTDDLSSAALFNTQSIWKYSNQPSINCLGSIVFTKGNTVSPYVLVGNINFNKVAICDSNGSNLQEIDVDKNQLFSTLQTNGVNVKTYSYFIYPGNENMVLKAYTLPLISYDNAYVYNSDGTYNLYGSYNQDNGIFTDSNGLNYFFLNDQTFSLTNTSTTLAQLESFDSTQNFITYNGSNYVYFGGCYWLATTISGNSATININKANNGKDSTTANVTYDTTNNLWLK